MQGSLVKSRNGPGLTAGRGEAAVSHYICAFRPCLTALSGVFLMLAAGAAEAQSRTNAHLRETIFTSQGFSNTHINRYVTFLESNDDEILPRIYLSTGGFVADDGARAQTLWARRIFNESRVALCLHAKGGMASSPMRNPRVGGSMNYNFLVVPGTSETILTHAENRSATGRFDARLNCYFWLADMTAPDGQKCSSTAPANLDSWARSTSEQVSYSHPRLQEALGLAEPYRP